MDTDKQQIQKDDALLTQTHVRFINLLSIFKIIFPLLGTPVRLAMMLQVCTSCLISLEPLTGPLSFKCIQTGIRCPLEGTFLVAGLICQLYNQVT